VIPRLSLPIDALVEELNKKLGDKQFYSLRELTSVGFFGSLPAARIALLKGQFPYIKISPRRRVIPRSSIIEFLRNSITSKDSEHGK
jgi:hypothetical protein